MDERQEDTMSKPLDSRPAHDYNLRHYRVEGADRLPSAAAAGHLERTRRGQINGKPSGRPVAEMLNQRLPTLSSKHRSLRPPASALSPSPGKPGRWGG